MSAFEPEPWHELTEADFAALFAGPPAEDATMPGLMFRSADGLSVTLWHDAITGCEIVVNDHGHEYLLVTQDGAEALDMFHHPYFYLTRDPAFSLPSTRPYEDDDTLADPLLSQGGTATLDPRD